MKTMRIAERTLELQTFHIQKARIDEPVEIVLLCLREGYDREAVGDDRMDLCLHEFTDQRHGGCLNRLISLLHLVLVFFLLFGFSGHSEVFGTCTCRAGE